MLRSATASASASPANQLPGKKTVKVKRVPRKSNKALSEKSSTTSHLKLKNEQHSRKSNLHQKKLLKQYLPAIVLQHNKVKKVVTPTVLSALSLQKNSVLKVKTRRNMLGSVSSNASSKYLLQKIRKVEKPKKIRVSQSSDRGEFSSYENSVKTVSRGSTKRSPETGGLSKSISNRNLAKSQYDGHNKLNWTQSNHNFQNRTGDNLAADGGIRNNRHQLSLTEAERNILNAKPKEKIPYSALIAKYTLRCSGSAVRLCTGSAKQQVRPRAKPSLRSDTNTNENSNLQSRSKRLKAKDEGNTIGKDPAIATEESSKVEEQKKNGQENRCKPKSHLVSKTEDKQNNETCNGSESRPLSQATQNIEDYEEGDSICDGSVASSSSQKELYEELSKKRKSPQLKSSLLTLPPQEVLPSDRLKIIREKIQNARKQRKVFMMVVNNPTIRRSLMKRGWIEKPYVRKVQTEIVAETIGENNNTKDDEESIVSRHLASVTPNFIWTGKLHPVYPEPGQIINRLPITNFTTKVGLCSTVQNLKWVYKEGLSDMMTPRCFKIHESNERKDFITNFRLTACISLLNWFIYNADLEGDSLFDPDGAVPASAVLFAVDRCIGYCARRSHGDLDSKGHPEVTDEKWLEFLNQHYMLVSKNQRLANNTNLNMDDFYEKCIHAVESIKQFWPEMAIDGMKNMWILKPGYKNRGLGIYLLNSFDDIMTWINTSVIIDKRYVIQKYVEHPLLMHNIKFDIRQWFLVTSTHPLVIWMYDECYFRFCSHEFTLDDLHESIHLCNNSVQRKYYNDDNRDPGLPLKNMCDLDAFKRYLSAIGDPRVWSDKIYPGMKSNIVGSVLASQESMGYSGRSFQLFGADFILSDDFVPWLLEINASPCMAPTTKVTAKLCPKCLEDVIRVVIDKRHNSKANTGHFRCVYRQIAPEIAPHIHPELEVKGKKAKLTDRKRYKAALRERKKRLTVVKKKKITTFGIGKLGHKFKADNDCIHCQRATLCSVTKKHTKKAALCGTICKNGVCTYLENMPLLSEVGPLPNDTKLPIKSERKPDEGTSPLRKASDSSESTPTSSCSESDCDEDTLTGEEFWKKHLKMKIDVRGFLQSLCSVVKTKLAKGEIKTRSAADIARQSNTLMKSLSKIKASENEK